MNIWISSFANTGNTAVLNSYVSFDNAPIIENKGIGNDSVDGVILSTDLGKRLAGYRNLVPETDIDTLARLLVNLSRLAGDFGDIITECDLNPVLVGACKGDVMVVDALLIR